MHWRALRSDGEAAGSGIDVLPPEDTSTRLVLKPVAAKQVAQFLRSQFASAFRGGNHSALFRLNGAIRPIRPPVRHVARSGLLDPAGLSVDSARRMVTRRPGKGPKRGKRKRISPETARAIELIDFLHECALGQRKASDAQIDRAIRELEQLVPEGREEAPARVISGS